MRCSGRVVTWSFVIGGPQTRFSRRAQLLHRHTSTNLPLCRWQVDVLLPQMATSKPASSHCVASMPMAVDNVLGNGSVRISWWNQIGITREGLLRIWSVAIIYGTGIEFAVRVWYPSLTTLSTILTQSALQRSLEIVSLFQGHKSSSLSDHGLAARCCPWDILIPHYPSGCSRKMKISKKKPEPCINVHQPY